MNNSNWVIVFSICLLFSSCQFVLKAAYGVKKPVVRTAAETKEHALKFGFDTASLYTLNYEAYIEKISESADVGIGFEIFDQNGKLIVPNDSALKKCNGKISRFLDLLGDSSYYFTSDTVTLDTYLRGLSTLNGKPANHLQSEENEMTAVLNWANYVGKFNRDVQEWDAQLRNHPDVDVDIIMVNLDFRDFWEGKIKTK